MKDKKIKTLKWIGIGVGIIALLWILLVTIKVPYTAQVTYTEQEPYESVEYYHEQSNTLSCNEMSRCSCLHYSWFGLGACDSCDCVRERTVTRYKTVEKVREETRYCNLWKNIAGRC
jgi:hypothetical protein